MPLLFPKKQSTPTGQDWQVAYSSFVLIMLSFFIMVCSFITYEESKITQFVRSFATVLSIFSGGVKLDEGKQVLLPSPDIVDKKDSLSVMMQDVERLKEKSKFASLVEVFREKRGLVMRLQSSLVFDSGSAEVKEEAKIFLRQLCPMFLESENPIRIEGHTDNVPIHTEEFPSNWELSAMRAVNVLKYLVAECHLDPKRVSAAGYAEFRPISDNTTEEGRAKNRRVELVILPIEQKGE